MPSPLPDVLARVDEWPVRTVAVGVTRAEGVLATHGPVDDVLPFASVTKLLSAYAVLIAAQDGALQLDEPVEVPGRSATDDVTVRHLLAHAGGLPMEAGGPVGTPGRKRAYSNWGYELLGELVASRVGRPFAEHLELEVLRPLGMSATVLDGSPAHAGLGTVRDLLAFARELLDPRLLDPTLVAEATTTAFEGLDGVLPGFGRQSPNPWGLGFELKDHKRPHWTGETLSPATFGHFGRSGSFLFVDPAVAVGTACLADRDFGPWAAEAWPPFTDAVVAAAAGSVPDGEAGQ